MKLKKKWMRLISCVLVVAIILQLTPVQNVKAYTDDEVYELLKEALKDAAEEDKEEIEEAIWDSYSAKKAGDWYQACINPKGDNLPWNYFHNEVQNHIVDLSLGVGKEQRIIYTEDQKKLEDGPTKDTGSVDLYWERKDGTYLWEVKPGSYVLDDKKKQAEWQLRNYVESNKKYEVGGLQIKGTTFQTEDKKYNITYTNMGDGLILYWFVRNPDPTQTPQRKPPSSVISNSSSKNDAKDDLADKSKPASGIQDGADDEDDEGGIAAIVKKVAAGLAIAGAVSVAVEAASKYVSSARALQQASVAFIVSATAFLANPIEANAAEIQSELDDYLTLIEAMYGMDYSQAYRDAINTGDQDKIDEIIRMIQGNSGAYEDAGEAQPPRDPLIIDFGAEGITLKSLEHGVNFDLDNNGFAEKTAWIGTEDGFLALDRNGNGKIDNGGELFGDQVIMKDGSKSASGFVALQELDDNEDGKIDSKDDAYDQL